MSPKLFFMFDVESVGLHGEGYAVGGGVFDSSGKALSEFLFAVDPDKCHGNAAGRKWLIENAPHIPPTHDDAEDMREAFWCEWERAKEQGAVMVADCGWPVEARFLIACIKDDPLAREWSGPYPLHEMASFLVASGMNPLEHFDRLPNELPVHDPLADARQSMRILAMALPRKPVNKESNRG